MAFNGTCEEDFFPCETCDYMKYIPDASLGLHCYMFLHKPVDPCMQHTDRKLTPKKVIEILSTPVRS